MALISKPNTFSAGAVIVASEHNENFDTLYNEVNGNLDKDNVKAASIANVTETQTITGTKTFNDVILKSPFIDVRAYGAVGDGATDDTVAIQAAINAATSGQTLWFPTKTFKITTSLIGTLYDINIEGNGAILDGSTSTEDTLLTLGGALSTSAALTTSISKGDTSLVTGLATSLAEHDIIQILSTDSWGTILGKKGEMAEVKSVSGTTVNLKNRIYDSYTNSTTTITKINMKKVTIYNLNITHNGNYTGLKVLYGKDIDINVKVNGARYTAIHISNCYRGKVDECHTSDTWYSGTGNSYGLIIGSSQQIRVLGGSYLDARHGVANGSGVGVFPYRDLVFDGVEVNNKFGTSPAMYSFDFHAMGEFISVVNCTWGNSLWFECRNISIKNNHASEKDSTFPAIGGYLYDEGNYVDIQGNYVYAVGTNATGILLNAATANTTIQYINISGNTIQATYYGIKIEPYNSSMTGVIINDLIMRDNDIILYPAVAGNLGAIYIASNTAKLKILNLLIDGGYLVGDGYGIYADIDATIGMVTIQNARIECPNTTSDLIYIHAANGACYDLVIKNNTLRGTNAAFGRRGLLLETARSLIVEQNKLYNFTLTKGVNLGSGTDLIYRDNEFYNCAGIAALASSTRIIMGKFGENAIAFGTAAPTAGTWAQGDVINRSDATSEAAAGWSCVTSGTFSAYASTGGIGTGLYALTVASATGLSVGDYITIAGVTGIKKVINIVGLVATIDVASDATVAAAATVTPDPTFKAMANLA